MKKTQHIFFILSLLMIVGANTVFSQKTWTGAVSTAWQTAGNWNPSGAPVGGSTSIFIPNTTNKPVFSTGTHDQTNNSISISPGASLTITGGTFSTLGGSTTADGGIIAIDAGGTLNISGGTLNNGGSIRNSGTINYTSGTYTNTGGHYFSQSTTGASLFTGTTFTNAGIIGDYLYGVQKECSYFGSGLTSTGTIMFNLTASNTPCTGAFKIVVTGTANLAGTTYEAWDINGNVVSGTTYTLLSATSITGFTNADISLQNTTGTKYVHIRKVGNDLTGLVDNSPTLSVELTHFAANTEGSKTNLTWATGSEVNSNSFDIERSQDGKTFTKIGNVKAQGKAANYNFVDNSPLPINSGQVRNTSYYRLKQMDNDQTFEYSKVISVQQGKGKTAIKIYPTTTKDVLTVENNGAAVDVVTVFNQVGQLVFTAKQVNRVDMSGLPAGLYLVQVQAGQEKVTEKVFKQ